MEIECNIYVTIMPTVIMIGQLHSSWVEKRFLTDPLHIISSRGGGKSPKVFIKNSDFSQSFTVNNSDVCRVSGCNFIGCSETLLNGVFREIINNFLLDFIR